MIGGPVGLPDRHSFCSNPSRLSDRLTRSGLLVHRDRTSPTRKHGAGCGRKRYNLRDGSRKRNRAELGISTSHLKSWTWSRPGRLPACCGPKRASASSARPRIYPGWPQWRSPLRPLQQLRPLLRVRSGSAEKLESCHRPSNDQLTPSQ